MFKICRLTKKLSRLSEPFLNQNFKFKQIINKSSFNISLLSSQINYIKHQSVLLYSNEIVNNSNVDLKIPGLNPDVNVEELTNGDSELDKKLRILILETDVMRQEGHKVPDLSFLKTVHWKELLEKTTRTQRKRYLEFLFKVEKKRENSKLKKEQARIERENRPDYVGDGHIRYGLNHNTFLLRIYDTTINQLYNSNLINAMKYGQPLVIDCGYDDNMTARESINCAKQIMLGFSDNRIHKDPFDLHLCNADPSKHTMRSLSGFIATLYDPSFPLHVHEESYLNVKFPSLPYLLNDPYRKKENLFPSDLKERLVYLTPHCRDELLHYDHDAIYIIGGIVDKMNQEPLSLAKAKHEKIRMAKLPLDHHLQWSDGSGKSLTINQMISILLDIKTTGDWSYALRHVPRRKIVGHSSTGAAFKINKMIDRFAPAYDRAATSKRSGKWFKNNYNSDVRSFDNLKEKNSKTNTKDLIKKLMNS